MSATTTERLYQLLPTVYRMRDEAQQGQLRALLAVIQDQVQAIQADIDHLYDNWFIETCDEWLVPYIGDLLRVRGLQAVNTTVYSQRAYVANTMSYRRRKGTARALQDAARDATDWPAHVVEFFQILSRVQHVLAPDLNSLRTPSLRRAGELERLGNPFERIAHTVNVRTRYNIPKLGVFLWRLESYAAERVQAAVLDAQKGVYTFSPLGNDTALFNPYRYSLTQDPNRQEGLFPSPLRPSALADELDEIRKLGRDAHRVYFGPEPSFGIVFESVDGQGNRVASSLLPQEILIRDLSDLTMSNPVANHTFKAAVDPRLGRLMLAADPDGHGGLIFPAGKPSNVLLSYHYAFSGDVGGGFYERQHTLSTDDPSSALTSMAGGDPAMGDPAMVHAVSTALTGTQSVGDEIVRRVIDIEDSRTYRVASITVPRNTQLEIRAANWQRPLLLPAKDGYPVWVVQLADGASLVLNGLLVSAELIVSAPTGGGLTLRHCTLVPGRGLTGPGEPRDRGQRSITITSALDSFQPLENLPLPLLSTIQPDPDHDIQVLVSRSITGPIQVDSEMISELTIEESVVDAAGSTASALWAGTKATATITDSTILGRTVIGALELASNTIFTDTLQVAQTGSGCVRFSYVPVSSHTPQLYRCQPALAISEHQADADSIQASLVPSFTSTRYGQPGYVQLSRSCPNAIIHGGTDESEMGVFHYLYQPQREAALRAAISDYLRMGLEAEILFVT